VTSPFALDERELRMAARFGFAREGSLRAGRLAVVLVVVAWLPLLLLTLAHGTAYGSRVTIPFLGDFLIFGRYLVALPLLVLLHPAVDRRIGSAVTMLRESGLVAPADDDSLRRALERAKGLWANRLVRLALVGISIFGAFSALAMKPLVSVSSWMFVGEPGAGVLTTAGWWNLAIGGPLVRLLLLLALWKLLVWSWFLWQLARMPLRYETLHPDRCAGLGFLDWVQTGFAVMVAALSVQLGCLVADAVRYQGAELASFKIPVAAFVVLMLVLLFSPLLAFLRPLTAACERTEAIFHAWASCAARQVGSAMQQMGNEAIASHLSSPQISTLTDATALFQGAVQTRRVPISVRALKVVAAAAILPMCVPLLPLLPLKELAARLAGIVL
jgi:hypothetical protein